MWFVRINITMVLNNKDSDVRDVRVRLTCLLRDNTISMLHRLTRNQDRRDLLGG